MTDKIATTSSKMLHFAPAPEGLLPASFRAFFQHATGRRFLSMWWA